MFELSDKPLKYRFVNQHLRYWVDSIRLSATSHYGVGLILWEGKGWGDARQMAACDALQAGWVQSAGSTHHAAFLGGVFAGCKRAGLQPCPGVLRQLGHGRFSSSRGVPRRTWGPISVVPVVLGAREIALTTMLANLVYGRDRRGLGPRTSTISREFTSQRSIRGAGNCIPRPRWRSGRRTCGRRRTKGSSLVKEQSCMRTMFQDRLAGTILVTVVANDCGTKGCLGTAVSRAATRIAAGAAAGARSKIQRRLNRIPR